LSNASPTPEERKVGRPYRSEDTRVRKLVSDLTDFGKTSADNKTPSGAKARAALAELRHSINDPLRGAKYVVPCLGPEDEGDDIWFYRIAALYAMHRLHRPDVSLGVAMKQCSMRRNSESVEKRFTQLLSAASANLLIPLRNVINLLAADEIPLDWEQLLDDVLYWNHPNKFRQHRLARHFYSNNINPEGQDIVVNNSGTPISA
jgi:CRISPR type I-E-associated protein CasB/Cse2